MSIFKRQRGAVLPNGLIVAITTDWDLTEICANGRIQKKRLSGLRSTHPT